MTNQDVALRAQQVHETVMSLNAIGASVRTVELCAPDKVRVWAFFSPVLYRRVDEVYDLGRNPDGKVKGGVCLGCEVCWLEPHGFRFKPPRKRRSRH